MKRISAWLLCLLVVFSLKAQTYWCETLDEVTGSGYYNIEVSQALYGLGANRLRILDAKGQEIPYFVRLETVAEETQPMKKYEVTSNTARDSVNTLVIHNQEGEASRFYLQMKRADVAMWVSVRGSYDGKQWFSVRQRSLLNNQFHPDYGEIAVVDFPSGDYTYYELVIVNNTTSPLSITGVGRVEQTFADRQFAELNRGRFTVEPGENKTTVISFPEMEFPYYLSALVFEIKGKGHYSREVQITHPERMTRSFQLTSRENRYAMDGLLTDKATQVVIFNKDNPPLEIEDIKLLGSKRYLCAYLEEEASYRVVTDGEGRRRYDIQDFAAEIPTSLPVVKTGNLVEVDQAIAEAPVLRFFEKPVFLWTVIILTGLGLLLLCVRMLRE